MRLSNSHNICSLIPGIDGDLQVVCSRDAATRDDRGILRRSGNKFGDSQTVIFGCAYKHGGTLYPAVDPAQAYDGLLEESGDLDRGQHG